MVLKYDRMSSNLGTDSFVGKANKVVFSGRKRIGEVGYFYMHGPSGYLIRSIFFDLFSRWAINNANARTMRTNSVPLIEPTSIIDKTIDL